MDGNKFYGYILENFKLDGTAARLVDNILRFVQKRFPDEDSQYAALCSLLDGAAGLTYSEIQCAVFGTPADGPCKDALAEKLSGGSIQEIEDVLGYPVSADVMENLEGRIREALDQMPEEELLKYERKHRISRKESSSRFSCEVARDFDGTYYANMYLNGSYVRGLPEYVPYDVLKNAIKRKTGIEIPDCAQMAFHKSGRKSFAAVSGEKAV